MSRFGLRPRPTPIGMSTWFSGGEFLPNEIANLEIWLDANDISTLWQDSAKTTPVTADSDVVGAWEDKSGNGNDLTQVTTANKPLYKTGQANGKAVIRGDGTDDYLSVSGLAADATRTFIVVAKAEAPSGGSQRAFGLNSNASLFMVAASTEWRYFANEASGVVDLNEDYTTYKALTLRYTATSNLDYESNVGNAQSFDPDDVYSSTSTLGLFAQQSNGANPGSVNIAEFVVYSRAITDAELANLMTDLRSKWGLA